MEQVKIIGIAGGSGSGKSTLAVNLCKKYPDNFVLIHLDDYFKKREDIPVINDLKDWDVPEAVRWDDLIKALESLKRREPIEVRTKSELYNPEYHHDLKNKINIIVEPKPVVILEGYMIFYHERVRNLIDYKIYLDIPIDDSSKRRSTNKFTPNPTYIEKILLPRHIEFIEPTKEFADLLINAKEHNAMEVFEIADKAVNSFLKVPVKV